MPMQLRKTSPKYLEEFDKKIKGGEKRKADEEPEVFDIDDSEDDEVDDDGAMIG